MNETIELITLSLADQLGIDNPIVRFLYFTEIQNWVPWTFWLVVGLIIFEVFHFYVTMQIARRFFKQIPHPKQAQKAKDRKKGDAKEASNDDETENNPLENARFF